MWAHLPRSGLGPEHLVGKDTGLMAWCLLGNLPQSFAEPRRELWRLGSLPLHSLPVFSPPTRNSRECRTYRRGLKLCPES
uniref:Uncharacterized protein n=1 Tax=Catagonus wagneri TaxID=51154 RepID=A0A8C3VYG7_9CETA